MPAPLATEPTPREAQSQFGWRSANRRFYQCPMCGGWIDSSDPIQVARHDDNPVPLTAAKVS